jgi:S-DNA-T family DNA segregation ATPase FtsK/SpoIIIE
VLTWCHWWGWESLATTAALLAAVLIGWRLANLRSFDAWTGRHLRAWWLRWTVYSAKLPDWLHACGLGMKHDPTPVMVTLTPWSRAFGRRQRAARTQLQR